MRLIRLSFPAVLLAACFAAGASAADAVKPAAKEAPKAQVASSAKVPKRTLGDAVSFKGDKLEDVLAAIRDTAGVNMVVAWPALEAAGIKRDFPVELKLRHVSAAMLLKAVLASASAGLEGDQRLGCAIEEGIVKVATLKELKAGAAQVARVYDHRDLEMEIPNFTDAPSMDLTKVISGAK